MGFGGYALVFVSMLFVGLAVSAILFVRKKRHSALLALAVSLLASGTWYVLLIVDPVANLLFFPDDTVYSARYSERAFREVKKGQSLEEVLSLLGEPFERNLSWDKRSEYWCYSHHGPRYANYWEKIVIFDVRTRRAVGKIDELYSR
jgi:hypothetical protein